MLKRADLLGNKVGIDLLDGTRIVGKVSDWNKYKVYVDIEMGEPLDIPRDIIQRIFIVLLPEKKV